MLLTLAPGSSRRTSPKLRGPRRTWSAACSPEKHGGMWEAWALYAVSESLRTLGTWFGPLRGPVSVSWSFSSAHASLSPCLARH